MGQLNFHVVQADWDTLKEHAQAIRYEVFVEEQNVPVELEWDAMDAVCLHAVAYDEQQQTLGTGRLLPDGHIGRMAVRKIARGSGVGAGILLALMAAAKQRGDAKIQLNAQVSAEGFYQRYGFARYGEIFVEAGIDHVHMQHVFP